jgi:hypothetical protein
MVRLKSTSEPSQVLNSKVSLEGSSNLNGVSLAQILSVGIELG